jgi:hypothetical protein
MQNAVHSSIRFFLANVGRIRKEDFIADLSIANGAEI